MWCTCDLAGNVFVHQFEKGIFSYDLDSVLLLKSDIAPVKSIAILSQDFLDAYFPEAQRGTFVKADKLQ